MSLLLHGPGEHIQRLSKYLLHYPHLVENNGTLPEHVHTEELSYHTSTAFLIENKYYSADLQLHLHPLLLADHNSTTTDIDVFEGLILIPANSQVWN